MTGSVQTVRPPLPCQESPDCGRTHLGEKSPSLVFRMESLMGGEVLHEERQAFWSIRSIHRSRPNLRLPGLPCLQICLCLDHRDYPLFLRRELHSCCSFLIPRTSTLLLSFASLFS